MSHAEKKTFAPSPSTTVQLELVEGHRHPTGIPSSHSRGNGNPVFFLSTSSPQTAGRQRGYALLLMLVMVTMGILFTLVSQLSLVGMKWGRAQSSTVALNQAKEALLGYAITYRDTHSGNVFGYLPCPDIDGDGSADALNAECGSTDGKAVVGLLPYKQLDLASNQDTDGNCLWYAVSGTFKASANSVSPYNLPMPMNWDTQGQIEVRDANDTLVTQPNDTIGGAAAVIFSVGPPLSSQSRRPAGTSTAPCGISSSAKTNDNDADNKKYYTNYIDIDPAGTDRAKSQPFPGIANGTVRVTQGITGSSINNDQIAWITPRDIFERVRKRSDRGGLNTLMTEIATALEGRVTSDLATRTAPVKALPTNPTTIGPTPYAGNVGELPIITVASNYAKLLDNWNEQYRSVVCTDLCGYCLNVGGESCNGALLFGAEHATGGPRPAHPTQLTDLFEKDGATSGDGKGALSIVNGNINAIDNTNSFTGVSTYSRGSADVGICVAPSSKKPVTFSCDINTFTPTSTHPGSKREASRDDLTKTITLGNTSANSPGSGCVWETNVLPFSTLLRAYFSFRIIEDGEGFVFTLADAVANAPGPPACGSATSSVSVARLGYSGAIKPKIGLEIDARTPASQRDSIFDSTTSARNDPPGDHVAFIFWGSNNNGSADDNFHGAGTSSSGTQPLNPTSSLSSSSCVQSASWSSNVATVTTATTHGLVSGQQVTISGITPTAYNGSYLITSVTLPTQFTYALPLASDPGSAGSGGSVSSAILGISTLTTCDTHLPYASWPKNTTPPTDIHVRLDIVKNHAGTSGTYTLKAYVATNFPTCSITDFQNVSQNLSSLCTTLNPSIEQDGIVIEDIGGLEALAGVYAGFTTAQNSTTSSVQSITVSNFLIRSQ